MCYWRSKAEITKRKAELLTVKNTSGKPIRLNLPLDRTVIFFPSGSVLAFKDCYVFWKALRANETTRNNNETDVGVELLQLKQV